MEILYKRLSIKNPSNFISVFSPDKETGRTRFLLKSKSCLFSPYMVRNDGYITDFDLVKGEELLCINNVFFTNDNSIVTVDTQQIEEEYYVLLVPNKKFMCLFGVALISGLFLLRK
jgi:hypothetical protein